MVHMTAYQKLYDTLASAWHRVCTSYGTLQGNLALIKSLDTLITVIMQHVTAYCAHNSGVVVS
jgi:hypothetical protein